MSKTVDTQAICNTLEGKIRGKPVAISRFTEQPPAGFDGMKIDPCQILRHAMDHGKRVYFDREHQDCVHGAFITGVHEGNEQIRSGHILTDYIPAYNLDAAHSFNSGKSVLPQGTVTLPGVRVAALCLPAAEVGGDYYDLLPLSDTRMGVLVADVSGKGTYGVFTPMTPAVRSG